MKKEIVKEQVLIGVPQKEIKGYVKKDINIGDVVEFVNNDIGGGRMIVTVLHDGQRVGNVLPAKHAEKIFQASENEGLNDTIFNREFEKEFSNGNANFPVIVGKYAQPVRANDIFVVEVEVEKDVQLSMDMLEDEQITPHLTDEEVKERVDYLRSCGASDFLIMSMLKEIEPIEKYEGLEDYIPKNLSEDELFIDYHKFVSRAVAYMLTGENILLKGDKGVGKNVMATTLAWLFRKPVGTISLNSNTSLADLVGDKTLEGDNIVFELEILPKLAAQGGIVVLDEMNAADPALLTGLNRLLDDNREIHVSGYGTIQADEGFRAIATLNPNFVGTVELNEATESRLRPFLFPSNDSIVEILQQKVPNANKVVLEKINRVYQMVQRLVKEEEVSDRVLDIRGMIATAKVVTLFGMDLRTELEGNIADKITDEYEREALLTVFDNVF